MALDHICRRAVNTSHHPNTKTRECLLDNYSTEIFKLFVVATLYLRMHTYISTQVTLHRHPNPLQYTPIDQPGFTIAHRAREQEYSTLTTSLGTALLQLYTSWLRGPLSQTNVHTHTRSDCLTNYISKQNTVEHYMLMYPVPPPPLQHANVANSYTQSLISLSQC